MTGIPEELEKFITPGTDRLAFLQDYLARRGVQTSVIPIGEKKHLYVNFPQSSFQNGRKIKTIISHYDIVAGSPGANDNSSCAIALADFAVRIVQRCAEGKQSNIRIFFTDGEELGEGGVNQQGAFGLAELLKKCRIVSDEVYVFDSCGRGTVPVLARAGINAIAAGKNTGSGFVRQLAELFDRTQKLLEKVCGRNWTTLPVPYSDNAGFLACGIPAVAVTFLPKEEVEKYRCELLKDKNLEKAVMNARLDDDADFKFKYEEKMPLTWRLFHTEYDNLLSLTPQSFELLEKLLDELAERNF